MSADPIVGHKTLSDDSLVAEIAKKDAERAALMPDEQSAINMLFAAWLRLKELGWRESEYCPKDGSAFDAIEPGSTGIHRCYYEGKWPDGKWLLYDGHDVWPSRPTLYRPDAAEQARWKALKDRLKGISQ